MKLFAVVALLVTLALGVEPNPPQWDTQYVKFLNPNNTAESQATIDAVYAENGGNVPEDNGQWSYSRYALMMMPGTHAVTMKVGYYTQVLGLGMKPTDNKIDIFECPNGSTNENVGALNNFWRGVENVNLMNANSTIATWAVSQAAPMRRVQVEGPIEIYGYDAPNTRDSTASGGYMADSYVKGDINAGP